MHLAPLQSRHRAALTTLLERTGRFRDREIAAALDLFDAGVSRPAEQPGGAAGKPRWATCELLGAFEGDALIGFACFGPTPATDRTYDLYWIAVSRDAQRAGVGTLLLRSVETTLCARGARMLVMETSSRDEYEGTRAFYLARDYVELARVMDFYAPGDDRVVYGRLLA